MDLDTVNFNFTNTQYSGSILDMTPLLVHIDFNGEIKQSFKNFEARNLNLMQQYHIFCFFS